MTRIKEPELGTSEVPDYKSPPSRIIKSLRQGYDNLRDKVGEKATQIQALQGKLRDTQESRDDWKTRAKEAEAKLVELQQKNEDLERSLKKRQ